MLTLDGTSLLIESASLLMVMKVSCGFEFVKLMAVSLEIAVYKTNQAVLISSRCTFKQLSENLHHFNFPPFSQC